MVIVYVAMQCIWLAGFTKTAAQSAPDLPASSIGFLGWSSCFSSRETSSWSGFWCRAAGRNRIILVMSKRLLLLFRKVRCLPMLLLCPGYLVQHLSESWTFLSVATNSNGDSLTIPESYIDTSRMSRDFMIKEEEEKIEHRILTWDWRLLHQ